MIEDKTIVEFATAADAVEIANLSKNCIEQNLAWQYTPAKINKLIKNKNKNVIVAREGTTLIGFGIMTYGQEQANLDLLAVKISHRRCGIGGYIVKWLEQVARTAGMFNIYVQVREMNIGSVKFYQRLGFEIIDCKNGYYQGQESALIMCKSLRQMISLK